MRSTQFIGGKLLYLRSSDGRCNPIYEVPSQQPSYTMVWQNHRVQSLAGSTHTILPSQGVSPGSSYHLLQTAEALWIPVLDVCILPGFCPNLLGWSPLASSFGLAAGSPWLHIHPPPSPAPALRPAYPSALGLCLFWAMDLKHMKSSIWRNHGKFFMEGLAFSMNSIPAFFFFFHFTNSMLFSGTLIL